MTTNFNGKSLFFLRELVQAYDRIDRRFALHPQPREVSRGALIDKVRWAKELEAKDLGLPETLGKYLAETVKCEDCGSETLFIHDDRQLHCERNFDHQAAPALNGRIGATLANSAVHRLEQELLDERAARRMIAKRRAKP